MDVFYNEFSTPQFFIKYNPQLPDLLSLAEVDGELHPLVYMIINTQMKTLLHSSGQKILDTTFSNEQVACILEWVSYPTLYFNPDTNFLSKYLCDEVKIVFLFAYDQLDAKTEKEKTNYLKTLLNPQSKWRKKVMVNSMPL